MMLDHLHVARDACLATGLAVALLAPGTPPAVAQSAEPGPAGSADASEPQRRHDLEVALRARLDGLACRRWREDDEPFDFGAVAAVRCARPGRGISQLALFAFSDVGSLADFWAWRIDQIDPTPAPREAACTDARVGVGTWARGEIACFLEDGRARMRWIDEETLTYGVADATDVHVGGLYRWWAEREPSAIGETDVEPPTGAVATDPRLPTGRRARITYLSGQVADPRHRDTDRKATTTRCRPLSAEASTSLEPLSVAGIECEPTRRGRARYRLSGPVRYFLFPSDGALAAWWSQQLREEPAQPISPWSGSFGTCFSPPFLELTVVGGETAWIDESAAAGGRVACWPSTSDAADQSLSWTIRDRLVGGTVTRSRWLTGSRRAEWFTAVHPDRVQAFPGPDSVVAITPFADPAAMRTLPVVGEPPAPLGTEPAPGPGTQTREATSRPGLPVGAVHPVAIEPCFGNAGFPPDVDGTFWQATGGVSPDGRRIRWAQGLREFREGAVVEFLKIGEDEAQVRSAAGAVVAYERHVGPRRYRVGCS